MAIEQAIFRRAELLLGDEAMNRIGEKRVIIFGVGGVGSWCAARCREISRISSIYHIFVMRDTTLVVFRISFFCRTFAAL